MNKTDGSTTLRLHDKVYLAGLEDVLTKMAIDMEHFEKRIVNLEERLHAALSVVTHQRKGNLSDNIINEVRHEPLARQAQLWGAKEALEKAKFSDVISDGEDIFNAIANQAISQVETLIESTKND